MRRWLALAVLVIPMGFGWSVAKGDSTMQGLTVVGYSINQIPPQQSDSLYPQCGNGWYANINQSWDYQPFGQCGWDRFMLHYTGFVTVPDGTQSVRFAVSADDGGVIKLGNTQFGTWRDKGCQIVYSSRLDGFVSSPLDGWFYENGGGTCFRLWWQLNGDNQNWEIVPVSAFSFVEPTTTTLQETTTTTELLTTSTFAPTTTEPPQTTPAPTQPSTVPQTVMVVPSTTSTVSVPVATSTSTTSTTVPISTATTQTSYPTSTTTTSSSIAPTTIVTTSVVSVPEPSTTTTLPTDTPTGFHNAEAVATLTNQIATITTEQAGELFKQIDVDSLTPTEAAQLIEAVQDAPTAIRKSFEKHINIYAGAVDTYVPVGSKVNVRSRRVIIAVGLVLIVPVAPVRKPNE